MPEPLRIAMWSGPRNLSTAMMRSFSSRSDCAVSDEPFYGAYLELTGLDHPMRADILGDMDCDPDRVARALAGAAPGGKPVWYQKHMCQHMVDGMPRAWMGACRHVFLIRHPARVMASYAAKRENPTEADLGFAVQSALFEACDDPVVVEAEDILRDPAGMLRALCAALGIGWDPAMLSWPAGPHDADGIWGAHWYGSIWQSTGFAPWRDSPVPEVEDTAILAEGLEIYTRLRAHRLGRTGNGR